MDLMDSFSWPGFERCRAKVPTVQYSHPAVTPGERFLMWVDAVGGYLVCLGDEVVIGPPTDGAGADVPILADISRRHAVVRRDGEGYWVEPQRDAFLDGRRLSGPASLVDGSVIQLGSVEIRFRRPHALSGTARLELISRHKTQPSVSGVLLMAESCVLGPAWHNHVVCRRWQRDVVLFRHGKGLYCRTTGPIEIGGQRFDGKGPLGLDDRVEGEDFSFTLEKLS